MNSYQAYEKLFNTIRPKLTNYYINDVITLVRYIRDFLCDESLIIYKEFTVHREGSVVFIIMYSKDKEIITFKFDMDTGTRSIDVKDGKFKTFKNYIGYMGSYAVTL